MFSRYQHIELAKKCYNIHHSPIILTNNVYLCTLDKGVNMHIATDKNIGYMVSISMASNGSRQNGTVCEAEMLAAIRNKVYFCSVHYCKATCLTNNIR